MNLQARIYGDRHWRDFGTRQIRDVIELLAWERNYELDDREVELRFAERPATVWRITAKADVRWQLSGLRGGDA